MIKAAFKPEWYSSKKFVRINDDGSRSIVNKKTAKNTYSMMEYNFSLFFGLAVQEYEATLVSDDAPIDRYAEGDENALTAQQKRGLDVFQTRGCNICHSGAEFTDATVGRIEQLGEILTIPGLLNIDLGFFNLGNRPSLDDPGIGGKDPFGNPLSIAKLQDLPLSPELGAFKTAGLRNVEFTAPYMHNGGMLTLDQVVDFYGRSGNFANASNPNELNILDVIKINFGDNTSTPEVDIDPIKAAQEKQDVVAFLKSLTDERVRYQKAPFDHPQLFVPNGHPGDQNKVKVGKNGNAKDDLMEIKAVGREGGKPIKLFLQQ
jgi:cytochrome c peroxidase